jgi:hypothetical protein
MKAKKPYKTSQREPRQKYGNKKVVVAGLSFDSKREAKRWFELTMLCRAGEISDLQRQVVIFLEGRDGALLTKTGRPMRCTIDFSYIENGKLILDDAKGYASRDWPVRKAVLEAMSYTVRES